METWFSQQQTIAHKTEISPKKHLETVTNFMIQRGKVFDKNLQMPYCQLMLLLH